MEQASDPFALSVQYGKKPSFSALVKERFLDEVLAAITSYAEVNGITIKVVDYSKGKTEQ